MLASRISGHIQRNVWKQMYAMGMLTDKLTEKQNKKTQEEFKK